MPGTVPQTEARTSICCLHLPASKCVAALPCGLRVSPMHPYWPRKPTHRAAQRLQPAQQERHGCGKRWGHSVGKEEALVQGVHVHEDAGGRPAPRHWDVTAVQAAVEGRRVLRDQPARCRGALTFNSKFVKAAKAAARYLSSCPPEQARQRPACDDLPFHVLALSSTGRKERDDGSKLGAEAAIDTS